MPTTHTHGVGDLISTWMQPNTTVNTHIKGSSQQHERTARGMPLHVRVGAADATPCCC